MNMGYDPNAGMGVDPNMNMSYDPNVGMDLNSNNNMNFDIEDSSNTNIDNNMGYDPNAGMGMDSNMNMSYDPNAGMGVDPNMSYDPNAGMGMDPNMNMGYDPNAGMGMDPNMNMGYDPNAGMGVDPNMNMGYDPNAGMGVDSNMNMGYDSNPGTGMNSNMNMGYDQNVGIGMDPNMVNTEFNPNNPVNPAPEMNHETFNQVGFNPISAESNTYAGSNFDKSGFNTTNEKPPKKSSKIILALMLLLCLIAIGVIVGVIVMKNKANNTYAVMNTTFDTYIEEVFSAVNSSQMPNDSNYTIQEKMNIKIDSENYDAIAENMDEDTKKVLDSLTNISVDSTLKKIEQSKLYVDASIKADNQELLDVKMNVNFDERRTFVQVKQMIDKYFEYQVLDEYYDTLKELLAEKDQTNIAKVEQIIKNKINSILKEEYLVKSAEERDNETYNRHSLKMTEAQLATELSRIIDELKSDSEFMSCFNQDVQEELNDIFDDLKDSLDEAKSAPTGNSFELAIFTKGFIKQEFVSGELIIFESGNVDSKINFKNNLRDGLEYEFNHYDTKGSASYTATGLIQYAPNVDSTVYRIELKSDKVTFSIDGTSSKVAEAEIEDITEDQIVDMNNLSELEILKIYSNFGTSNIYKLMSTIMGEDPLGELFEDNNSNHRVEPDEPEEPEEPEWEEPEEQREPEQPEWEEPNPEEERNEEENWGEEENQEEIEVEEF